MMKLRLSGLSVGVCANFQLPISRCYSNSILSTTSSSIDVKPKVPLYLRPPSFSASLSELAKWHKWAKNLASSVGSSFVNLDSGPDSNLLRREVNWLLQDSLELQHHSAILSGLESGKNEDLDVNVSLRAPLEELYCLWKQRIEERRPFQYVVGCEHWRDLVLSVQEGVLIPRPETEMIIDLVDDVALNDSPELARGFWADLGTGSGAIAIATARSLATHGHDCGRVFATDLSSVAVAVAASNVQRYGLQTNGEKQCRFLVEYIENDKPGCFRDINIVSDFAGTQRFVMGFHQ